jgi:hypothetical protein
VTTRKHIDRHTQGSAQRNLPAFACAFGIDMQSQGHARLDRSEPTHPPGKGSA